MLPLTDKDAQDQANREKGAQRLLNILRNKQRELDRELEENAREREVLLQQMQSLQNTMSQLSGETQDTAVEPYEEEEHSVH